MNCIIRTEGCNYSIMIFFLLIVSKKPVTKYKRLICILPYFNF